MAKNRLNNGERKALRSSLVNGESYSVLSERFGITKSTIWYHAKRAGLLHHPHKAVYDWNAIRAFYETHTRAECKAAFGFSSGAWSDAIKCGRLKQKPRYRESVRTLLSANARVSRGSVKRRLIQEGVLAERCKECGGGTSWNGKPIVLVLDHVNGINNDYREENLRLLCPNCNSQTDTFSGRNVRKLRLDSLASEPTMARSPQATW